MSSDNNNTDEKLEDILKTLSEDEKNLYISERTKIFKLTIFICALYAFLALLMLIIAFATEWGKKYIYGEMLPFVVTYVIGTIIIIIFLSNEVYNYKPIRTNNSLAYDVDMCPDYWKLENNDMDKKPMKDEQGKLYLSETVNQGAFKYKCVLDEKLFNTTELKNRDIKYKLNVDKKLYVELNENTSNLTNIPETKVAQMDRFKEYSAIMTGYSFDKNTRALTVNNAYSFSNLSSTPFTTLNNGPLQCDIVFPYYLSQMDIENKQKYPDEPPNRYRCAYANACGVDWTEAGCVTKK